MSEQVEQTASERPQAVDDEVALLRQQVEDLRHDLRAAVDAVRAAEAERATAAGRLRHVEYALHVAEEREKELVDLVAKIDEDTAEARSRYDELVHARSFKVYRKLLAPYVRLRSGLG